MPASEFANARTLIGKGHSDDENVNNFKAIFNYNEKFREANIENRDIDIKLNPGETMILTSYFDFEAIKEEKNEIYCFIAADIVFVDENGKEIIDSYYSEYMPYLEAGKIRELSKL